MLVSAVLDPSAFDPAHFDELYRIHAEDFFRGIGSNGLLIVDSENRLRNALIKQVESLPIKYGQRLRILVEEILLKKKSKRVVTCHVSPSEAFSGDLLELTRQLKRSTKADALIVKNQNLKTLEFNQQSSVDIVPLSEYRDSGFEKERQKYYERVGPIDTLSKEKVDDIIIRSVRFTKWLRFYDKQIGKGTNTSNFQRGIAYILTLWGDHGFFSSQLGTGEVEIFTCIAEQIRDDETDHAKKSKMERNLNNYQKIIRDLIGPLKKNFPDLPVKLFVKSDPDGIFHARYLETQHAVIRVDRGFDLFKGKEQFWRNFFTLNMEESSHLRECRDLPDAPV